VALAASRQQYVFAREIDARKRVGQAQGILMERFGLDPDQAFELLGSYAKKHRMKLIETAQELVTGRELPRVTAASSIRRGQPGVRHHVKPDAEQHSDGPDWHPQHEHGDLGQTSVCLPWWTSTRDTNVTTGAGEGDLAGTPPGVSAGRH
jgi:hypothetical protein